MNMTNKLLLPLLILLITITVAITGYIFYSISNNNRTAEQLPTASQQQEAPQNSQSTPQQSSDPYGSPDDEDWWLDIQAKAVETSTVDVTDCKLKPEIASLSINTQITLTNSGQAAQRLFVTEDHIFTVPAEGELSVEADFGKGDGAYKVYCNSTTPAGVFVVVE